ncbi:MAG: pantoate--beta-alanine ligase [Caldithrix sp.]|nr:pantoate--beta-alanine ligase [Caldithrix sp.]
MKVFDTIEAMRAWSARCKKEDLSMALVPTMGYLHEGHLSLVKQARLSSKRVVVSIYVNPAQFAPGEDLDRYPRDIERDLQLCREEHVDAVFFPTDAMMYPEPYRTYVITQDWAQRLCGKSRPTHFRGVTTIVTKLFNIIEPHLAVFGQKDAQQAIIIKRMTQDLNFNIRIIIGETLREEDGLAMSSRNKYLTTHERKEAPVLYRSLQMARQSYRNGQQDLEFIKNKIESMITQQSSGQIDYIEAVDFDNFEPPEAHTKQILIALAVQFGKARLIDNIVIEK